MATTAPTTVSADPASIGVCLPAEFPHDEIRRCLEDGGLEIAFWQEPDAAVSAAKAARRLDFFILGVRRPDREALKIVRELRDDLVAQPILICERSGEGEVRKALEAGVRALVPLDRVDEALLPVIGAVRAGQVSVPERARDEAGRKVLTAREKQILAQVVLGMTNAEIAAKLYLAESTVKSHLSSAFAKLGVTSRNEAAALILNPTAGVGLGILTIPAESVPTSR